MISPLAHVDPSAKIGNDVTIHPFAFIDKDVEIGDGCEIMPYDKRFPDPSIWRVLDNRDAAKILQQKLDEIDG